MAKFTKDGGVRDPVTHRTPKQIKSHYVEYGGTPAQIANRTDRNAARAKLAKEGLVHKGDGNDVDHKHMIKDGGSNARSNLHVVPTSKNRGWRATQGTTPKGKK